MRGDGGRPASMVPMQPAPWTGPCASWAAATQPMLALEHSTAGHTSWTKAEELPGRRAAGDAVLGAGGWTQPVCPPGLGSSFERFEAVPAPGVRCVGESRAGVILVPRCLLPRPRFRTVPCEAPSLQPPAQPHLQALHVAPDAAVDHLQNLQLQRDGTGPQPQQYFLSQPDTESPACGTASSQPFSHPPPDQNPHLRRRVCDRVDGGAVQGSQAVPVGGKHRGACGIAQHKVDEHRGNVTVKVLAGPASMGRGRMSGGGRVLCSHQGS